MPFLSPDWRCPGEKWIKSPERSNTWENAKDWRNNIFASINDIALKRIYRQSLTDDKLSTEDFESMLANISCFQPHIRINLSSTREIPNVSTITDVLVKLDMKSAIRDVRRFNYVCTMVCRLLADKFHTLTGRSQLYITDLLKVIMHQVLGSCNQTLIFRQLLDTLRSTLDCHAYDHIGSSQLWANHWNSYKKMKESLIDFDSKQNSITRADKHDLNISCIRTPNSWTESKSSQLESLPFECLKSIAVNVSRPEDLDSASLASPALALVVNDEVFWRRLTTRSFTPNQIMSVQFGRASWKTTSSFSSASDINPLMENGVRDCNWRRAYIRLLRRFGEQQIHSACLGICDNCSCLYWMLLGHPCYRQEKAQKVRLLAPEEFIALFAM